MKKILVPIVALLFFATGCNVNRSMTDLTQSSRVKYKLNPVPESGNAEYYTYAAKGFTKANVDKYRKLSTQMDSIDILLKKYKSWSKQENFKGKYNIIQNQLCEIPKDSTYNYIVSFSDNIKGIDYAVVRTYWWDYSNWRFLVPFLTYFNRWHNFNQCVNRAVEKCIIYNCDGVIIAGDYSTFKLFIRK